MLFLFICKVESRGVKDKEIETNSQAITEEKMQREWAELKGLKTSHDIKMTERETGLEKGLSYYKTSQHRICDFSQYLN